MATQAERHAKWWSTKGKITRKAYIESMAIGIYVAVFPSGLYLGCGRGTC